jgi:hypothetical protein
MSWQCLSSADRKARKSHKCIWCGEAILPGEKYVDVTGIFEGDFQNNKFHPECSATQQGEDDESFCAYENERPGQYEKTN